MRQLSQNLVQRKVGIEHDESVGASARQLQIAVADMLMEAPFLTFDAVRSVVFGLEPRCGGLQRAVEEDGVMGQEMLRGPILQCAEPIHIQPPSEALVGESGIEESIRKHPCSVL